MKTSIQLFFLKFSVKNLNAMIINYAAIYGFGDNVVKRNNLIFLFVTLLFLSSFPQFNTNPIFAQTSNIQNLEILSSPGDYSRESLVSIISSTFNHPSSVKTNLEQGGFVKSKSFQKKWIIYRSIGGAVEVRSKKKKRKWYCAWLCKKNKKKKLRFPHKAHAQIVETSARGVVVTISAARARCTEAPTTAP